jgi:hypothetical protein
MGEGKPRREAKTPHERLLEEVSRKLADEGRLIEAGWVSLQAVWVPPDAPPHQVRDMRWAFMAGAQHLWASIMTVLEPDAEPTEKDLERMNLIAAELDKFGEEIARSPENAIVARELVVIRASLFAMGLTPIHGAASHEPGVMETWV